MKRTNRCLPPFATPTPSLLSILTWSMISARLLPPPVPSHGTRSPAASLDCSPVLVQYLPAAIQPRSPHTDEAAWQPTAAAPLHRGMLLSLLVSLSVTAGDVQSKTPLLSTSLRLFLFCCSGWRLEGKQKGRVRVLLTSLLDSHAEGTDSRSAFSFSSSLCKLAPRLASPPSLSLCSHFPPLFPSPFPPPATTTQSWSGRMRVTERGGQRAEIGCQGDHVTPGRGLRDPLPAVQLMLP